MQTLKAKHRTEFSEYLRFTIPNKMKAIGVYVIFLLGYGLLFTLLIYIMDWIKGHPYQFHFAYLIVGWICALAFTAPSNSFQDHRLPFFAEKYIIDQDLRQDLTQLNYIKANATIIEVQIQPKRLFRTQFHTLRLQLEDSEEIICDQYVHLNLLFPSIFLLGNAHFLKAATTWIGQQVEVCYLPQSKRIFRLQAKQSYENFQLLSEAFSERFSLQQLKNQSLPTVPSALAQNFIHICRVDAVRHDHQNYELQMITNHQTYIVPSSAQGFNILEKMLCRIDQKKYREFKQNPQLQSLLLYPKN